MDSICNDVCSPAASQLSGLQEMHTDFDSWICKFSRYCYTRSPQYCTCNGGHPQHFTCTSSHNDLLKSKQQNDNTDAQYITINDLLIEGYLFSKNQNINSKNFMNNELNVFLSLVKDEDVFVNFDSVLLKLINGRRKHFHQYTKSKL
ncbi:uncharacterized protein LOC123666845 [Melitaea cinxia]|uniref:uncharacterized protein LOC123666845 n=1 Tax=Melitaea cinxia TaxID=113334 RepID=UPI001E271370|nr:uncharacterized protein LOC123666845 [Melitaea cinxia]